MGIVEGRLSNSHKTMHIRSLSIKSINITVYSGEDFAFLKTSPGKLKYVEESVAIELNEDNVVTGVMMLENRKSSDSRVRFRS
jgi:hypothetical protein